MLSINSKEWVDALFDRLDIAVSRCLELPFDELTTSELQAVVECCELVSGRLAALQYELTSPFARHGAPGQSSTNAFHHPKNPVYDEEDDDCDGAA